MRLPTIKSLYGRIFAIFWLTLLLVLIAVLAAQQADPRQQHELPVSSKIKLQKMADTISNRLFSMHGSLEDNLVKVQKSLSERGGMKLYFTNLDGEVYNQRQHHGGSRTLKNFTSIADDPHNPQQRLYGRWMLAGPFLVDDGQSEALMYVGRMWREAPPFYAQILDKPFQLLLVTMVVSTPLLLWLAWALSRPARRLQAAAERVAEGRLEIDPTLEKGPREFRQAGASFNQMVTALNQMISGQQRLLSDISHELRSPLTRLRMANALAIRKQGESANLTRIDTEAERMEQMIADLLSLSRMQLNSHAERETFTLEELWLPLLDDAEFEAEQHNKTFTYQAIPNVTIDGNGPLLCSALENVVRNAIKYADQHTKVSFSVEGRSLKVDVSDDGEGVPSEMLADIFKPFYRVSTARDRASGGTGLGLAITDSAMRQHNGRAEACINDNGGLTVTLVFGLINTAL
ncbi:envelope stress sensor histidine kinase CpxA [Enterovibrio nigricans]|uniref:histidine kinase n=1 Tax=Enterovibrio nigricans DSM 22720 TaxID=1121868 RepID=A0A1T4U9S0_9GAMM|nr:envelope stress sensor histidine kinase CpxA [Enterovibrio nigricans]SKA49241.1 two-component system, OmpR family, sensor histidine kinase CpxA [Enterovibrio nigricans DSM 22720]